MDDSLKSSQSDASAANTNSGKEPSLEAGLAALKRKDYPTAIALLQAIAQTSTDKPTATKAQMSLVMAYERSGDLSGAIALSQTLSKSSNRQVRLWAMRMMDELVQRQGAELAASSAVPVEPSEQDEVDETGFTPLNTSLQNGVRTTLQAENDPITEEGGQADESGFVPLNSAANLNDIRPSLPTISSEDESGFVPLTGENLPLEESRPMVSEELAETSQRSPDPNLPLTPESTPIPAETLASTSDTPSEAPQMPLVPAMASVPPDSPDSASEHWRQAGRASKWGSLGSVDLAKLWAVEAATVVVLVLVVRALLQVAISLWNIAVVEFRGIVDLREHVIYADPLWLVLLVLGVLFIVSPWLMDGILRLSYRARPLTVDELATSSPEAVRVLKRICNQRRYPMPSLSILPIPAPVAFTYGVLPQNTRMVISRGLLQQLSDDEIATIVIGEFGHVTYWNVGVMSWVALVAQLPYQLYWIVSTWGDRQRLPLLKAIAVGVASIAYGLFWVVRWTGLCLSRLRVYYSDRAASEVTGNPNGLTRALLKIVIGVAADIQRQGSTSALLQSFDVLTPVGYQTALTLGSTHPHASWEQLLMWDWMNPYRHWLAINNSHPPMGDRLKQLANYARRWRLATELDLPASSSTSRAAGQTKRFWLQIAPFVGMLIGLSIATCLWLIGTIAATVGWVELIWLTSDQSIWWGFVLLGLSIGTILRINPLFPDLKPSTVQVDPALSALLSAPNALPTDSHPIRVRGTLIGRSGIGNILTQDLILQTETGCVRLHYMPLLGPMGHILPQPLRPSRFVKTPVTVTGWFRRGATPWIDVEIMQAQRGAKLQAAHPWWSTLLGLVTAVLGAYIIFRGGG
ncbi:M48 family metalloprotease [Oscillatoria sp. FACHB-1407]|uniref:zinc metalloprotease HtpX n=1 Tax=Oscillatoria sp. FACHB-1407 TaxID=2692847 RepID=UPI00168377BD|nr:zinc metalloprotease HtpX [Oscillatoria sp. FACHB-1407]MBD2465345.1 M48 family metalloprotease [Oscillatoria sp. FACHB-1407]